MAQAVHIFIAYARKDSALLDEFRVHLRPLERADKLRIWYDGLIEPGAEWEASIKQNLHAADIILLLVSADAIASDYFYDKEVADALERHRKGSARVVPMIVRPCAWTTTPLAGLQALPKDGKPVTSWSDRDEAFTYAAEALWDMAHSIQQQREEKEEQALREKEAAKEARRAAQKAKEEAARRAEQERLQRAEEDKRRKEAEARRREKEAADARKAEQERWRRTEEDKQRKEAEARRTKEEAERKALLARQAEYARHMAEARKHLSRRDWRKAQTAAQAALALAPGDADAQLVIRKAEKGGSQPPPLSPPYLIWAAGGVGTILVIFMLINIAIGSGKEKTSLSTPVPAATTSQATTATDQPDLVLVTGGTFSMGCTSEQKDCYDDEKPVTRVTVDDFYMGKYAVTVREFKQFIEATGYKTDADKDGGSYLWTGSEWEKKAGVNWKCDVEGKVRPDSEHNHPVIHVSWNDAAAYCNWLSEQQNLSKVYTISGDKVSADWSAKGYRLPTEAEWEYAARGGGKAVLFGNGKNVADPKEINFDASAAYKKDYSVAGEYRGKTVSVGSLNSPNTLGLHDMSGNVWEWCWDWKAPYPGGHENNYRGPASGSYRVCRGGSWYNNPRVVRVANRSSSTPDDRVNFLGFRLARAVR